MSSLLYIIYTNEIPLLSNIMTKPLLKVLTNENPYSETCDISTYTIQYVDDSSNMISTKNIDLLQEYTKKFFRLLEVYYQINMLTLNQDKSKFMIICKGSIQNKANNVKLKASNYVIKQSVKVKF